MRSLILAGGYGTRLYELVKDTPKALLDVNGKPIIDYILERIKSFESLDEVIVVTNNKFYSNFQEWADRKKDYPHKITVVNDLTETPKDRLGSIGDIDFTIDQEKIKDDLLVIGGDNLFDFNLEQYLSQAQSHSNEVTIGLFDIDDWEGAKKFGIAGMDSQNKLTSFEEKPEVPKSTLAAMCFYYLPGETLSLVKEYLQEMKTSDRAGDYIKWLMKKMDVFGFKFQGSWYDIGSIESYRDAQEKFKTK